ncbi:unnamed protein product [Cunninghamella blakesleeana]
MPRKPLFRTNNKTETKNNKLIPETVTAAAPPPEITAWIEEALEKANTAVLFDFTSSPKQAMESYNEAIDLLKKVFEVSDKNDDQTRLKKIYESYIERVGILSLQLDNNELDDSSSVAIPIAKEPPKLPLPSEKVLPPKPQPSISSSTTATTTATTTSKSKKSSPLPLDLNSKSLKLPQKSPKILSSKSSSGSLFSNMFAKKSQPDLNSNHFNNSNNSNNSNNKNSSSIFSMPTPSKSTPTLSLNRSNLSSWKKPNKKKNQYQSTEMDALDIHSSQIELPTLPIFSTTDDLNNNNNDDYFDLQSIMSTKDLLYSQPEPMLESLRDLHQKNTSALDIDLTNTNTIQHNNSTNNNNSNNNNNTNHHQGGINSNKSSLEIPEPPLMSNNSSNDTYFSTFSLNNNTNNSSNNKIQPISQQQLQSPPSLPLASSASSFMTTSTSFTKSIYSPNRSSFYSTNFSYRFQEEDEYSIASSKNPAPLFLNNDLLNFGNENDSSTFDMESFAKVLAESAATMPDRHHRRKNTSNNNNNNNTNSTTLSNNNNTVNTIKEMENEDMDDNDNDKLKKKNHHHQPLSRSLSNKSVTSTKSYDSSITGRSSTSSNTPPPLPNLPIIPTPSTSSKSTKSEPSTFWSKKNKTTKPKTFKSLAPINILENNSNDDDIDDNDSLKKNNKSNKSSKKFIPSSISSIISPPPMTASTFNSDIISPITPTTTTSFNFGVISPSNSTSKITPSSSTTITSSSSKNRHRTPSTNSNSNNNKGVDMKISMGDYLHNEDNKQPKLMGRLLQSMEEGGFITDKIHAPKQLWYQTHVRLPAIDAKINSCEQILSILYRMQSRSIHQHNDSEALEDFNRLEFILDSIKQTFGKINYDHQQQSTSSIHHHHNNNNDHHSTSKHLSILPSTSNEIQKQHQQLHTKSTHTNNNNNNNNNNKDSKTTWSSKLSKSVERMKIDNKPT